MLFACFGLICVMQQGLSGGIKTVESCTVPGCEVDLLQLSAYHRRHRVCNVHLKTAQVELNGQLCRYCQQCGRFQPLADFQDSRRSCKAALRAHNQRRRQNTIASDTILASTRFRSSSSSSRRTLLGSTSERLSASSTCRHLARSATLSSSAYDAEGVGALRRTTSNPENCRKLRSSSQQSQEAWPGNCSFSDDACHLQQQLLQPYSMEDSPTTSSGLTAGHQQQLNAIPRAKAQPQQRPGKARVAQQLPHGGFMLPQQQQQQVLHMTYGHQHCNNGWSGGYQPPAAVAQLDALQLLKATAQPADGASTAGGASIMPEFQQGMGGMQQQGSQFMPEFYTDTMLDWAQQAGNPTAQQMPQQQGPTSEGLPALSILPGWQQQQQQQLGSGREKVCLAEMLPTWQQPQQQQSLPGTQGCAATATIPPAWQQKPPQQPLQPQAQPQRHQFVPKRHGLTAAQLKAIWARQQQADARMRMQQSNGLGEQGARMGQSAGLPATCAGMDKGAGLPPTCAGMGLQSAEMPGWPVQADTLQPKPQQQAGNPAWPVQASTPLLLPATQQQQQQQQQSTLSSAGWPVADMQPISTGRMGQANLLRAVVCSPMDSFGHQPQLLHGATTLGMQVQRGTSAQWQSVTLHGLFPPPGQQQLQDMAQDMCALTPQGFPVQQTYAQVSQALCIAPAQQQQQQQQQLAKSSGMCAPMPQRQVQHMSMQASSGATCTAPAQQQQYPGMASGMCLPVRQQQKVSMQAYGTMHAVQTQQQQLEMSSGMCAPRQQLQGISMQALGAMHAASAQNREQPGMSISMCAPMPQQLMQTHSMQTSSGAMCAVPAQQQQQLTMSSGMCMPILQQQVQDISMQACSVMCEAAAQQPLSAPVPAQQQVNLQMSSGQLCTSTKQEALALEDTQQLGLLSGPCVSPQKQQQQQQGLSGALCVPATAQQVSLSAAMYAPPGPQQLPVSGALCGPVPQQRQHSNLPIPAGCPPAQSGLPGVHVQQWVRQNAQTSTGVLTLPLAQQLGPVSMHVTAGDFLAGQQGLHAAAAAAANVPSVTYVDHVSPLAAAVAASTPTGADAPPAGTRPLAAQVAAAAQGTHEEPLDDCLSPDMGILACIEAEGGADNIPSEEIDALLEHAFSNFLGAGHVQQAYSETADACELLTSAAAVPADIQSSTADPIAWASAPGQQQY